MHDNATYNTYMATIYNIVSIRRHTQCTVLVKTNDETRDCIRYTPKAVQVMLTVEPTTIVSCSGVLKPYESPAIASNQTQTCAADLS